MAGQYDKLPRGAAECKEVFYEILKEKGLDHAVCNEIIDTFFFNEDHMSVADFAALLKEKKIHVSHEIIALALKTLSEFGFARERQFAGETALRYEHLHPHAHHDHFICLKCKRIVEFRDNELEMLQDGIMSRKGFRPVFHKLEIYGICDECSFASKKPIPLSYAKEEGAVTLYKIESGWHMRRRFIELGFLEKEKIIIIKNAGFGPIVVEVKGTRLAIGRGEAEHMLVYENE